MNVGALLEVNHSCFVGGIEYGWKVHTSAGVNFVPAGRVKPQILMQRLEVWLGFAVAGQVHREHPPACAAPEGSVIDVVIKYDQISGIRFQRDAAGEITRCDAEKLLRPVRINLLCSHEMIGPLAAGDDSQTARIACEWIEIERDLAGKKLSPTAIRMPAGITGVIIAIPAGVVEVFAQDSAGNA